MPRGSQASDAQTRVSGSHLLLQGTRGARRKLQAFIQAGLKANEKVVLVIPGEAFAEYLAAIQEGDLAENLRTHSEQLALLLEEEVLIEAERGGRDEALRMFLEDLVRRGLGEGWSAVRFAHLGITWGEPLGTRWEEAWDYLREHFHTTILCFYSPGAGDPPNHILARHEALRGGGR